MAICPKFNDREFDLWFAQASNWYEIAFNAGISGLTPPSFNDRKFDLQKKICYYTCQVAQL